MKKGLLLALVLLFGIASLGLAQTADNVGNTSQKGSLLIFPKIDVRENRDTLVSISNDYPLPVWVKCFWVDKYQIPFDFMFQLTANQPITFSAKYGLDGSQPIPVTVPPFASEPGVGELKCFATDNFNANQISWNHLMGSAKVVDFDESTAYEYNAWSFKARAPFNQVVGTGGQILMDGVQYDACPQYYLGNFIASSTFGLVRDTDLTLVPCKQDLRQERKPTFTKAKFDIWNENETKYTGVAKCLKCWFEGYLSNISDKFTYRSLHTCPARFRVNGLASDGVCKTVGSVNSPFIGLLVEVLDFSFGVDGEESDLAKTASEGFGSGKDTSGFVLYDPGASVIPESSRR